MNNSPFIIMNHEIIISSYKSDSGYSFAIMIDEWRTGSSDLKLKWENFSVDDFVTYIAGLADWNAGDLVRIVYCHNAVINLFYRKVR